MMTTTDHSASDVDAREAMVPLVLDAELDAPSAIRAMDRRGQAIAFVQRRGELLGVVTVEDLLFAWDWAGPSATAAGALSLVVVEVARGSDHVSAARAFGDAQHRWLAAGAGGPV